MILVSSTDLAVVLLTMGGVAALVETRAPTVQAGVVVALMFVLFGGLVVLRAPRSLGPLPAGELGVVTCVLVLSLVAGFAVKGLFGVTI